MKLSGRLSTTYWDSPHFRDGTYQDSFQLRLLEAGLYLTFREQTLEMLYATIFKIKIVIGRQCRTRDTDNSPQLFHALRMSDITV